MVGLSSLRISAAPYSRLSAKAWHSMHSKLYEALSLHNRLLSRLGDISRSPRSRALRSHRGWITGPRPASHCRGGIGPDEDELQFGVGRWSGPNYLAHGKIRRAYHGRGSREQRASTHIQILHVKQ